MKKTILKSILAGILIGLGAFSYVACTIKGNQYIGSFLFSIGLISVFLLEANLFTGKIGSLALTKDSIVNLVLILVFNFVGIGLLALISLTNKDMVVKSAEIVANKLNKTWYQVLVDSVLCGAIIELSVLMYKKSKSLLTVVISIMAFILSGFEHCIANMFYFILGYESFEAIAILYFVIYIIGNSIGAIILHNLYGFTIKDEVK